MAVIWNVLKPLQAVRYDWWVLWEMAWRMESSCAKRRGFSGVVYRGSLMLEATGETDSHG